VLRGILLLVCAGILFPISDAMVKHLAATHDPIQLLWARSAFFWGSATLLILIRGGVAIPPRTTRLGLHLLRGLVMVGTSTTAFIAFALMPLAEVIAILFVGPLVLVAVAGWTLGEPATRFQIVAVVVGFIGALLIVQPSPAGVNVAAILALTAAVLWAVQQILARKLSRTEASLASLFYVSAVCAVLSSFMAPFFWTPPDAFAWTLMVMTGLIATIGQWCVIKSVELAPVSTLGPINYIQILTALALGYFIFAEVPDPLSGVGLVLICGAGLAVALREARRRP